MIYRHLSPEQTEALYAALNRFDTRPTVNDYNRVSASLEKINKVGKPKVKGIPNTALGYEAGDVKLLKGFNAEKDLPSGWCVFSHYDSGGNFGLEDASVNKWRSIWNTWPSDSIKQDSETSSHYVFIRNEVLTVALADKKFPSNGDVWVGCFTMTERAKALNLPEDTIFFDSFGSAVYAKYDIQF